jgi:hypothetical protein
MQSGQRHPPTLAAGVLIGGRQRYRRAAMTRRTTELTTPVPIGSVWDALWNEAGWPVLIDAIEAVEVLDIGDRHGNGRLRRIHQHRRWWDPTIMMERTERVAHQRSIDAVVHHHRADVRHTWRLRCEPTSVTTTGLALDEDVDVDEPRYPGEARILTDRLLGLRPALLRALG